MKNLMALCAICILAMAVQNADAARRKVRLNLDYARMIPWNYALEYRSECVITENNATSTVPTRVYCELSGVPSDMGDRFTFTVDSVAVSSDFYDAEKQASIVRKLTRGRFAVALINGCPVVDTLSTFSVSELSEWDMVIQFAKLLPDIPREPVRRGYSWDASGAFPLMTSLGKIPCEVYRLYQVDSLTSNGAFVHISWRFRYAALHSAVDTSAVLKRVPVSGQGSGTAVIDAVNEILSEATVRFETPVASYGGVRVKWVENTTLRYRR